MAHIMAHFSLMAHIPGSRAAGSGETPGPSGCKTILWTPGTQCTPLQEACLPEVEAMEVKKVQERSGTVLERRTRTTGEEWHMSADDIMNKKVINSRGDDIGSISDMRVSFPEGRVKYLVLKHGGTLGMGAKHFAIPPEAVIYRSGDDNFVVNIDKQQLDDRPGFDKDNWPQEADTSLIQSSGAMTPPTREEAEAMRREVPPPAEVVKKETIETRPRQK